jgi:hypothetical protein
MSTNSNIAKREETDPLDIDRSVITRWTRKTLSRERILNIVLFTSNSAILGVVLLALHKAFQNAGYTGFGIP